MQTERQLARFAASTPLHAIAPDARRTARRVLLAVTGTGIAGAFEEGIDGLRALLRERGGREEASTIVFGDRLPAASAAMLNGTMCRALDFCDAMAPGVHIGASLVPAALAAAQYRQGCSGAEFLAALALGAEIGARLNLTESMYDGFDPTGIAGVFAAAAAAGRVLQLDEQQMLHALALAFQRCGGSFQANVDGSLGVRLLQGFVAEAGVNCALLAGRGLTGPTNFIEGIYGFTHLYARNLCESESFVQALGERWRLNDFLFKKFPSCGVTQGVTEQALQVREELGLTADAVRSVEVRLPPYAHRLVGHPFEIGRNPRVNAQFSVQYCVANAIVRGASRLEHFREEAIRAPELTALIGRVTVLADESMNARGHSSVDLDLVTTSGHKVSRRLDVSPGFPGRGLDDAEHLGRFEDCMRYARRAPGPARIAALIETIGQVEILPDVQTLLPLMEMAP